MTRRMSNGRPNPAHRSPCGGLVVTTEGARLRVFGPKRADAVARQLLEHKAEVMSALAPAVEYGIGPENLPTDWRVEWEERAAIMEYDGGLPRERAEASLSRRLCGPCTGPAPFSGMILAYKRSIG